MRLIDADALEYHKQLECMGNGQYEDVKVVYECEIDNAPTIEAEPVKHGVWNKTENEEMEITGYYCSVCDMPTDEPTNYCPNCGAKMDKGGENECTYI